MGIVVVHVDVLVTAGSGPAFREASEANARASLGEPGVLRFDVLSDLADPERFVLVEVYQDADSVADHKTTPHYAAWRDAVADLMARPRTSARFTPVTPQDSDRWRTPPGASADTMGWDG